ncbi:MAG: Gfo/Idh/MocA family protein [Oscillospiraceae bacterium]
MSDVVRWGILGNAMIARDFMIPAMEASDLCQVTAVASRTVVPASIAPRAKHYDSYEALLHDPEVDAVYVPVPNALHEKWSIEAMCCGKHVLCEKPMACTAAAGERMLRAAEDNGVLLMEAFMYRYGEPFRKMMQIVSDGTIGPIAAMYGCHGYTLDWASPAREEAELGGGSIYDVGCYVVDCMNAVMAQQGVKPTACSAVARMKGGVDWNAAAWLKYENGVVGSLQCWFDAASEQRVLLAGQKGTLMIPNLFEGTGGPMYLTVDGKTEVIQTGSANPYQLEAEAFSRAVLGQSSERMPLSHTIQNLQTLEGLYNNL